MKTARLLALLVSLSAVSYMSAGFLDTLKKEAGKFAKSEKGKELKQRAEQAIKKKDIGALKKVGKEGLAEAQKAAKTPEGKKLLAQLPTRGKQIAKGLKGEHKAADKNLEFKNKSGKTVFAAVSVADADSSIYVDQTGAAVGADKAAFEVKNEKALQYKVDGSKITTIELWSQKPGETEAAEMAWQIEAPGKTRYVKYDGKTLAPQKGVLDYTESRLSLKVPGNVTAKQITMLNLENLKATAADAGDTYAGTDSPPAYDADAAPAA